MKNPHASTYIALPLFIAVFLLCSTSTLAQESKVTRVRINDIGKTIVVIGELGLPIGQRVTIHGTKVEWIKYDAMFQVDMINQKRLDNPVVIEVPEIKKWNVGAEATLEGFEQGQINFTQEHDGSGPTYVGRKFTPKQVLYTRFETIRVRIEQQPDMQR